MQVQPTCWRAGCSESYPLVGEMCDDRLVVARGIPSKSHGTDLLHHDAKTTWFTTWRGAVHDSWWVIGADDEDCYVEIGTVQLWDASNVTPLYATIEDSARVDIHALVTIELPSEVEWEESFAETRAAIMGSADLRAQMDELLNSRDQDDEEDEEDES